MTGVNPILASDLRAARQRLRVSLGRATGAPPAASKPSPGRGWKAAWRTFGDQRCFFRSRWEQNYCAYLEWLRVGGHIKSWEHEPETFWFLSIKRGVRSYLPDFRVTENDGRVVYHEVKGWLDPRSKTNLARMKRYYPQVRLLVIDKAQYASIKAKAAGLVPGWEQ